MCIEHCVTQRSSLLRDRHLDQVLLTVSEIFQLSALCSYFDLITLKPTKLLLGLLVCHWLLYNQFVHATVRQRVAFKLVCLVAGWTDTVVPSFRHSVHCR